MQQVGSHQQDIVPAMARRGCWARGHWRCHEPSRATESAGARLASALCAPRLRDGCVGGYSQRAPVVERCRAFLAEERLRVAERRGLGLLQGGLQGVEERHRAGLQSTREGVREKFPPHPPSAAGVSCPDTSAGTDHPIVALPPFFLQPPVHGTDRAMLEASRMITLKSSSYLAHQKSLGFQPQARCVKIPSRNCKSLQVCYSQNNFELFPF